jgi:ArsR family transcriptional regulator
MILDPQQLAEQAEGVAQLLKQLSNKYRLMILCSLSEQELSVGEINERIDLSQSALSQHLTKLREAKLVTTRRESQTIFYNVADENTQRLLISLQKIYCED